MVEAAGEEIKECLFYILILVAGRREYLLPWHLVLH